MKHWFLLLRMVISVLLIAILVHFVNLHQIAATLHTIHLPLALLVIALTFGDRVFMTAKWRVLVRALDIRLPFLECLRAYLVCAFASLVLPTSVGADVLRLLVVGVDKGRRSELAATIVIERLLGFLAVCFLIILGSATLVLGFREHMGVELWLSGVVFAVLLAAFALSLRWMPVALLDRIPGRVGATLRKVATAYQLFRKRRNALLAFFGLSLLEQLMPVLCNYLVAVALHLHIHPIAFFVIIPVTMVFARLPISFDGLGVQETLFWVLFPLAGMSPTDAVTLAVTSRVLTIIALLPGGVLMLLSPTGSRTPQLAPLPQA